MGFISNKVGTFDALYILLLSKYPFIAYNISNVERIQKKRKMRKFCNFPDRVFKIYEYHNNFRAIKRNKVIKCINNHKNICM